MKVVSTEALTKLIQLVKSAFISVDDTIETSEVDVYTKTEIDNKVVDLTTNQTVGGVKTFTSPITVSADTSDEEGHTLIELADTANKAGTSIESFYKNSAVTSRLSSYNEIADKTGYINVQTFDTGTRKYHVGGTATLEDTNVNNTLVVCSSRAIDSGQITFVGQQFKFVAKELSVSANADTTFNYGITFSATPTIVITRRSSATTTSGAYDPWVRGSKGTSSSKIYSTYAGTIMVIAMGY